MHRKTGNVNRYAVLLTIFLPFMVNAQRKTVKTNIFWTGYFNNIIINKRWMVYSDIQGRTRDWTKQFSQVGITSGLTNRVNKNFSVTAGFAFFKIAQYVSEKMMLRNEYRPWQEVALQTYAGKNRVNHRLRTEQRFVQQIKREVKTNDYESILRVRYKIDWQLRLKNNLNLIMANEVMVNPLFINTNRFFNQDRISASINWKKSHPVSLQWQYMKVFLTRNNEPILENQNVYRFSFYHQINLKK